MDKTTRLKVPVAEKWSASRPDVDYLSVVSPFDWTYSTRYRGTLPQSSQSQGIPSHIGINYEMLKKPDSILFFDSDFMLFEDELADHGLSQLCLKVRVMPQCMLLLQRLLMRLEGVLCRLHETRIFYEFGADHVVREYVEFEVDFETVKQAIWRESFGEAATAGEKWMHSDTVAQTIARNEPKLRVIERLNLTE